MLIGISLSGDFLGILLYDGNTMHELGSHTAFGLSNLGQPVGQDSKSGAFLSLHFPKKRVTS